MESHVNIARHPLVRLILSTKFRAVSPIIPFLKDEGKKHPDFRHEGVCQKILTDKHQFAYQFSNSFWMVDVERDFQVHSDCVLASLKVCFSGLCLQNSNQEEKCLFQTSHKYSKNEKQIDIRPEQLNWIELAMQFEQKCTRMTCFFDDHL